ncbi:hypothetical protein Q7C36_004340 [Tachysurus vachellii]|uniref:Uncharacterized protein n=1 Tax=Tachysurus vachellii TaxID=175792 RepID=A0AA88NLZ0_TACVA|nr:hypothetical protein Q7C36_004340 [Tachysurus vachellii]
MILMFGTLHFYRQAGLSTSETAGNLLGISHTTFNSQCLYFVTSTLQHIEILSSHIPTLENLSELAEETAVHLLDLKNDRFPADIVTLEMAQKRSSNSPSSEAKKIRVENDPTSSHDFCFGETLTFPSSLLQHDSYTSLNPYLTDAINELNDSLRPTLRHDIQNPNPGTEHNVPPALNDSLRPTHTRLPHHDMFLELNQSLLTLQNSLNVQDQPVQLNPALIEVVNNLNDSFNLSKSAKVPLMHFGNRSTSRTCISRRFASGS